MRIVRPFTAIVCATAVMFLASGCETLGNHRRDAKKDTPPDIYDREPVDPAKAAEKKTSWNPGSWSSQARDIEKNMMRNSADPNW